MIAKAMIVILKTTAIVIPTAIPIFGPSVVAPLLLYELSAEIVAVGGLGTCVDKACNVVVDSGEREWCGAYEVNHANGPSVTALGKPMRVGTGL